ncbi:MAG: hypothetical protein EXR66_00105 [Dehalococcoidia bacterium]|nr:hypothetical protein [Dehalococcoidia bacterium]
MPAKAPQGSASGLDSDLDAARHHASAELAEHELTALWLLGRIPAALLPRPLLIALAAAYEDVTLARATARLAAECPAPRPYGRTRSLDGLLRGSAVAGGGGERGTPGCAVGAGAAAPAGPLVHARRLRRLPPLRG